AKSMTDRFLLSSTWAQRFADHQIAVTALLRHAGLPAGLFQRPTLQDVGRELGMGARTLQRRLTDAGLTFQQVVEETRRELAHHYLKQRSVELSEAAFLLGFEDANSFFRAFHAWEGTSPSEWRTRNGAAATEALR